MSQETTKYHKQAPFPSGVSLWGPSTTVMCREWWGFCDGPHTLVGTECFSVSPQPGPTFVLSVDVVECEAYCYSGVARPTDQEPLPLRRQLAKGAGTCAGQGRTWKPHGWPGGRGSGRKRPGFVAGSGVLGLSLVSGTCLRGDEDRQVVA